MHTHSRGFFARCKRNLARMFGFRHSKVVTEVHERSRAFNTTLMERRLKHGAQQSAPGTAQMPERWMTATLGELEGYYVRSNDAHEATTLPDSAWGLLDEAGSVFGENGHRLMDDDIAKLKSFALSDENLGTVTLATLFERKLQHDTTADHLRLQTMKVKGRAG